MGPRWLTGTIILLSLGASAVFFAEGNWRAGLYWFFAAGLNTIATIGIH
jgi:hypothetical protein